MYYKLTQEQIADFEKTCAYNAMIWTAQHRAGGDGTLKNVNTGEKKLYSDISYEEFDVNDFPLFGRNASTKELNTESGYTKYLVSFKESTDGYFYAKQLEDKTIEIDTGIVNENGEPIKMDMTIPYSDWFSDCVYESTTETEPEWPVVEDPV